MKSEPIPLEQRKSWNEAFAKHSRPYWNNLFRFALSLSRDRVLAEDLVQSTLMRAVQYFPNFACNSLGASSPASLDTLFENTLHKTHLKNWLLKITKNVFLTQAAALAKTEALLETEQELESLASQLPAEPAVGVTQSAALDAQESELNLALNESEFFAQASNDELKQAIDSLNSRQRSILYLVSEGCTYKEVADTLHMPIGTVMSALSRAIAKIKGRFQSASANASNHEFSSRPLRRRVHLSAKPE